MDKNPSSSGSLLEEAWRTMSDESRRYTLSIESQRKEQDGESNKRDMSTVEDELEKLMEQVTTALPIDDIQFEEAVLKENLEEVLLMLVALHGETNGKELLSDLAHFFDAQLSPGTLYPNLHALEEEELLAMHSMVRTKEYSIEDENAAHATIEQTMVQHLAFGLLLYAFLSQL